MMDVPNDAKLFNFVPGSEEAVADFDLSLLGDVAQQCPVNRGWRVFFRLLFEINWNFSWILEWCWELYFEVRQLIPTRFSNRGTSRNIPCCCLGSQGRQCYTWRRFRVMRRESWRQFQNLRSRTVLRCGRTARSVWFNQMGTTSNSVWMTKNSTNAEIWVQVRYFSDTPRILSVLLLKFLFCWSKVRSSLINFNINFSSSFLFFFFAK